MLPNTIITHITKGNVTSHYASVTTGFVDRVWTNLLSRLMGQLENKTPNHFIYVPWIWTETIIFVGIIIEIGRLFLRA